MVLKVARKSIGERVKQDKLIIGANAMYTCVDWLPNSLVHMQHIRCQGSFWLSGALPMKKFWYATAIR